MRACRLSVFKPEIENVFQGLSHVVMYLDDALVTGRNHKEYLGSLDRVLSRQRDAGQVRLLGSSRSVLGSCSHLGEFQRDPVKAEAELKAQRPSDIMTLQSFVQS